MMRTMIVNTHTHTHNDLTVCSKASLLKRMNPLTLKKTALCSPCDASRTHTQHCLLACLLGFCAAAAADTTTLSRRRSRWLLIESLWKRATPRHATSAYKRVAGCARRHVALGPLGALAAYNWLMRATTLASCVFSSDEQPVKSAKSRI